MDKKDALTVRDYRAWKKENPDWPLTVHPCGQWVKSINGRAVYFGPLCNREKALAKWLKMRPYVAAKLNPPIAKEKRAPKVFTVERLIAKHLADMNSRVKSGRLASVTRCDYATLPGIMASAGILKSSVDDMSPTEFAKVAKVIETSGRSLRTQKNLITSLKSVFNWGANMELCRQVNFGPRLKPPSAVSIENECDGKGIVRFIDREIILAALAACDQSLKIAILLGINCAFYPSDTVRIPRGSFHFEGPIAYHDFRRVKTLQKRKAVLWPETVDAIERWWHAFRPAKGGRKNPGTLITAFGRLVGGLGVDLKMGISIGSLRHTFASVVDSVPDQTMIDLVMGHTSRSIQKRVYTTVNLDELDRLKVVSDKIHNWLYGE